VPDPVSISDIQLAVQAVSGCPATHLYSYPVHEQIEDQSVWRGDVEVFKIAGHEGADKAYAWAWNDEGEIRYHVVLNEGPITSPVAAVKEAIARGRAR
jgi:hypothetical protein